MLKKVLISKVATFDETGISIENLNKVNFIYGTNGTGKSTISHFFNDISGRDYSSCEKKWNNDIELKSLVYNKKFREENFGKGKINGVFTLGKATREEKGMIEQKRNDAIEAKELYVSKKETYDKQVIEKEKKIEYFTEEISWKKIFKKYEPHFKEAFKGSQHKITFRNKLLSEFESSKVAIRTIEELQEEAKTIFGKRPESISPIQEIEFLQNNVIEADAIWETKIIGKTDVDIAKLIQYLNINDWVSEGKKYIQVDSDTCPFCQQKTITADFRKQLNDYFDQSFVESTKKVKALQDEYISRATTFVNQLNEIERSEKANENSKLEIEKFSANLKTLISQLSENREHLKSKIKEPSRSITLISTKEQLEILLQLIQDANAKIKTHNDIVINYNTKRTALISSIWKYIIEEHKTEIQEFLKNQNGLKQGLTNLKEQYETKHNEWKTLDNEAKELGKNLTSIEPTINEINRILRTYGFLNFEIVPATEDNYYQIKREDGTLAESSLSEGEVTFITFLYFLQLAKGAIDKDKISEERILVIDDPVSSLDSNVLFIVSTLIKEVINNIKADKGIIKQLILFTHNVYFHKEVSFIDGRTVECKHTNFWILRKNNKISKIQPFGKTNPIKTSYSLLWEELREWENNSLVSIQNIMRRIIENYFRVLGGYSNDQLIQFFSTLEEQNICRSLLSWINDGSHSFNDDLYIEQQDETIEKYMNVFKAIFVETKHEEHYNMMMNIANSDSEE
ncbi:MAG: AAA family ATPase [Candidatus Cloacimonetes bacterium]|nr:AAA family ATPase [Candidatus Cloacimonadota bacterium]